MEEDLRTRLRADPDVGAIVGDRVDWNIRRGLPAITLTGISPGNSETFGGTSKLRGPRVQIDARADSYGVAKQLARAIIPAVTPPATVGSTRFARSFLVGERDLDADDDAASAIFGVSLDFIIWVLPL